MTGDEYLERVKKSLRGLPAQTQADLVEEIAAHLAERPSGAPSEEDPRGSLEAEMGAPEDLGRRLKQVHRPIRWIDYLLIAVPETFLISFVVTLLSILLFPALTVGPHAPGMDPAWGMRLAILFHAPLIVISLIRRKQTGRPDLLLYWLPATWLTIFSLCFREQRWLLSGEANDTAGGLAETLFWLATLVGLGAWLVRVLWRSRDAQLTVLALLPFLVTTGNVASSRMIMLGGFPDGYNLPGWRIGPWFGVSQVTMLIWPALFYLFAQRQVRWLGLVTWATPIALSNLVASALYPGIAALWALPLVLVLGGWLLDHPFGRGARPLVE